MGFRRAAGPCLVAILLTTSGCGTTTGAGVGAAIGGGIGFLAGGPRGLAIGLVAGAAIGGGVGAAATYKKPLSTAELLEKKLPPDVFRNKWVAVEIVPSYNYAAEHVWLTVANSLVHQGAGVIASGQKRSPDYVVRIAGDEPNRMLFLAIIRNGESLAIRASPIQTERHSGANSLALAANEAAREALAAFYK